MAAVCCSPAPPDALPAEPPPRSARGRTGTGTCSPRRLGGREGPGSGSAAPASCANEEPPPGTGASAGPSTRPAGSGNVRRPRQLQIASTRRRPELPRPGPCPTLSSLPGPLFARARLSPAASTGAGSAQDPSQSRGQLPGMFPSLLAQPQQPMARPSSPSRHRWGLLLKAVLAPRAPGGFHSSGRRFHNPEHGLCGGMQPWPGSARWQSRQGRSTRPAPHWERGPRLSPGDARSPHRPPAPPAPLP